jgi:hypothetical protein
MVIFRGRFKPKAASEPLRRLLAGSRGRRAILS